MKMHLLSSALLVTLALGCSDDSSPSKTDGGTRRDGQVPTQDQGTPRDDQGGGAGMCELTCSTVDDCPQGANYCEGSRCFVCKTNTDCQQGGVCDTQSGFCVECLQDSDCMFEGQPYGSGKCHPSEKICAKCEGDADCSVQTQGGALPLWSGKCDTSVQLCVRCDSAADCQVTDQQGTVWPYDKCSTGSQCVECVSDADCSEGALKGCGAGGFCSECRSDAECCGGTAGCGLTCQGDGRCTCSAAQQCNDAFDQGLWTCTMI